jgi:transcriptional regulator with XRE-family HTH domain
MMEKQQAERIRLRFGLTLKLIIGENKSRALHNAENNIKDPNLIDSYGKLESASGLRKATLIDFASGKSDSSCTTIGAILEALNMTLSEFGSYYDKITEKEISDYKKSIEKKGKKK